MTNTNNLNERIIDDVLSHLNYDYTLADGEKVQGEAIHMSGGGLWNACCTHSRWRNLGCLSDFESLLEELGFRVVRGNNARVVTV